jgi:hypothetical protein
MPDRRHRCSQISVVSSRWETAALPPLPYTRRCCADDLVSRVAKPSRPFLYLVGLVGSIDNDMSGLAADRRGAQSLTLALRFRAPDRTLTEEQASAARGAAGAELVGAVQRG